ncbi:Mitogen-activated protein kinase kinase kinase YODA [Spatholobus suberectus]|nr:Mitogen-activated protein kinase kinase kinase YODA [Spatholobus suberectus]
MEMDNSPNLAFAVDIWSLGCTMIEMFTRKPPWSQYEGVAALFKVIKETPTIPETLSPKGKDFLRINHVVLMDNLKKYDQLSTSCANIAKGKATERRGFLIPFVRYSSTILGPIT